MFRKLFNLIELYAIGMFRLRETKRIMTLRILFLPLILVVLNLHGQEKFDTVDGSSFKIDGMGFTAKKDEIFTKFGKPISVFEPNYDCGFLSEKEQGSKFYSLMYKYFRFTGNSKEGYLLEKIHLEPELKNRVTFQNKVLSHKTTVKEFETIFGIKITDSVKLYHRGAEDALVFTFFKGRLVKIEYWSPC